MSLRRAAASAALAVAPALLTGCTSFAATLFTSSPPGVPPARTSGELADGFVIEPDTALLGAVFPRAYGGWQALLRVDGDARAVFDRYAAQADDLGIPVPDSAGDHVCSTDREAALPLQCSSYESVGDRGVELQLHAEGDDGRGYLLIQAGGSTGVGAPPLPDGPTAAVTDEQLTDLGPDGETPVRLVEGSVLLGEPIPYLCGIGGYLAVLHVSGDAEAVFRGYTAQFEQDFQGEVLGDDEHLLASYWEAGAGTLDATAVRGNETYLLIDRCVD